MDGQHAITFDIIRGGDNMTVPAEPSSPAAMDRKRHLRASQGFTLLEVVFAISLLGISVLGLAMTIPVAVQSNNRNRVDAQAALIVQKEVEQMLAQPLSTTSFTDSSGSAITISAGGAPLASGKIDFNQAVVTGYNVTVIGNSGGYFQLRWNVQSLADGSKQFTVAAIRLGGMRYMLPPVNIVSKRGAW